MFNEWFRLGGPVMYPLLLCSVVAMTVVTERCFFWLAVRRARDPRGVQALLRLVQAQRIGDALRLGRTLQDPVARVLTRGLEHWPDSVTSALEVQVQEELGPLRRYLGVLETMITLAPLLGIYGTITGIIRAFGFLGRSGVPDPSLVASGIAEALITTAAGLTIAIAAIPPYNFFAAKTEQLTHDLERQATHLELLAGQRAVVRPIPLAEAPGQRAVAAPA